MEQDTNGAAAALARVMAMPGAPWAAMGDAGVRLLNEIGRLDSGCALNAALHPSMWPIDTTDPSVETVLRRAVGGYAEVAYGSDGSTNIKWWAHWSNTGEPDATAHGLSPVEAWCALVEKLGGWPGR